MFLVSVVIEAILLLVGVYWDFILWIAVFCLVAVTVVCVICILYVICNYLASQNESKTLQARDEIVTTIISVILIFANIYWNRAIQQMQPSVVPLVGQTEVVEKEIENTTSILPVEPATKAAEQEEISSGSTKIIVNGDIMTIIGDSRTVSYSLKGSRVIADKLNLGDIDIRTLALVLRQNKNLTDLDLSDNDISNADPLFTVESLTSIKLNNNKIVDIGYIEQVELLEELHLDGNDIQNIEQIASLKNLKHLSLKDNAINDVSALKELNSLNQLYLDHNNISGLSSLTNLEQLAILTLSYNSVNDISPLANLKALHTIDLGNNEITDIGALKPIFANLIELNLEGNDIVGFDHSNTVID
jgi:Leucine-rich repeat (LRR) protein